MKFSWLTNRISGILLTAAVAGILAGCATGPQPLCKGPVGLQLYSLRAQMGKDVPGTLAEVHRLGFKYVELAGTYNVPPAQFRAELSSNGLEAVSGHYSFERWRDDPEGALREAASLGLVYVGCAWIPHDGPFTARDCRRAIAVFERAGKLAARHHMHFFYHTHGYEFQPYNGGTLFDLLVRETKPSHVNFEMDIFWIVHAGQNPVQLMEDYPHRWILMHLKDMKRGTKTGTLTGSTSVENDVALGTGKMDLPSILEEAARMHVQWYFIEDESSASEKQIPQSLTYLLQPR